MTVIFKFGNYGQGLLYTVVPINYGAKSAMR